MHTVHCRESLRRSVLLPYGPRLSPPLAGEKQRGRIEEDEIQPPDDILALGEGLLLDPVPDAPGKAGLRGSIVEFRPKWAIAR